MLLFQITTEPALFEEIRILAPLVWRSAIAGRVFHARAPEREFGLLDKDPGTSGRWFDPATADNQWEEMRKKAPTPHPIPHLSPGAFFSQKTIPIPNPFGFNRFGPPLFP